MKFMRLILRTPTDLILDKNINSLTVDATDGSLGIRPSHVNYIAPLVPGILLFKINNQINYAAIDRGYLLKNKKMVFIITQQAVLDNNLKNIKQSVDNYIREINEHEETVNKSISKLSARIIKSKVEILKND